MEVLDLYDHDGIDDAPRDWSTRMWLKGKSTKVGERQGADLTVED